MSDGKCLVEECTNKTLARGLCNKHYKQQRASGELALLPKLTLHERFWAKVDKTGDCWNWTAATLDSGYGVFTAATDIGASQLVHRFAFEQLVGEIPDGREIDHRCHNRRCVNPKHLRVVTHKQNQENRAGAQRTSISGIRGIYWLEKRQRWCARVKHNGRYHSAGWHHTREAAEAAVIAKRNELFSHNDKDRAAS